MKKLLLGFFCAVILLLLGPVLVVATGQASLEGDWRTANRDSAGLAPDPQIFSEAVVQVYAARAFRWRGAFGVHTWIALKPRDAMTYEVFEVLGWRARWSQNVVSRSQRTPDARWYGSDPRVLFDLRGEAAEDLIQPIVDAINSYPYADRYSVWPGPNSNTFTAYVSRKVRNLEVELPVTAIGKDYSEDLVTTTPSGTGFMLGFKGLAGVSLALNEGIELNLLGLSFGLDFDDPAIKWPGVGRIGMDPAVIPDS